MHDSPATSYLFASLEDFSCTRNKALFKKKVILVLSVRKIEATD
jgi:hypothetical protein